MTRRIAAQVAANERWARTVDRSAATANARQAFLDKFAEEVDPAGVLSPDDRERRARNALRAHMARLRAKSVRVRAANATRVPPSDSESGAIG